MNTLAINLQPMNLKADAARESGQPLDRLETEAKRLDHEVGLVRGRTHPLLLDTRAGVLLEQLAPKAKAAHEQLRLGKAAFLRAHQELWAVVSATLQQTVDCGNPALTEKLRALEADYPAQMYCGLLENKSVAAFRLGVSFVWRKRDRLLRILAEFQTAGQS